ncbi:Fimbrial protein [Pseudomonas coronafaciens pv. coronafaciens]|uniref:fimbrial protein n=1 Tax=Pseudomonas coronafaciens TaxID=53409 RepID=UPI000F3BF0DD|nr:fimbrial protein [Pseudomonas coronafaciens]RMN94500.1 Fimbrial protein [Pseudomonas coronafaciens pv. coronafaciens]
MKSLLRTGWAALALIAGAHTGLVQAQSFCAIRPAVGTLNYHINVGTLYAPKDAKAGAVIGMADLPFSISSSESGNVYCVNDGHTLTFNSRAINPPFAGTLPPVNGEDVSGKVLDTGIPGIGAIIKLEHPFDGVAAGSFIPLGKLPTVPFNAQMQYNLPAPLIMQNLQGSVTLVKTGVIAPGPQVIGNQMFYAALSAISGRAFEVRLSGTVMQAQCGASAVSDDPVKLGDWRVSDFKGPTKGTPPVAFNIRLGACEADPADVNIAWANIRLDGVSGSMPVPGTPGGFTLTSDSTAGGVGIQIMRNDGLTPVALGADVPIAPVASGTTMLDFSARYFQIDDTVAIQAGEAKGALSFTISFQ